MRWKIWRFPANPAICISPTPPFAMILLKRGTCPAFHPRRDVWAEHFRYEDETGEVVALTATGRVTIACLRINSAFQIRARRQ